MMRWQILKKPFGLDEITSPPPSRVLSSAALRLHHKRTNAQTRAVQAARERKKSEKTYTRNGMSPAVRPNPSVGLPFGWASLTAWRISTSSVCDIEIAWLCDRFSSVKSSLESRDDPSPSRRLHMKRRKTNEPIKIICVRKSVVFG